jgi:hypothetical protein
MIDTVETNQIRERDTELNNVDGSYFIVLEKDKFSYVFGANFCKIKYLKSGNIYSMSDKTVRMVSKVVSDE